MALIRIEINVPSIVMQSYNEIELQHMRPGATSTGRCDGVRVIEIWRVADMDGGPRWVRRSVEVVSEREHWVFLFLKKIKHVLFVAGLFMVPGMDPGFKFSSHF